MAHMTKQPKPDVRFLVDVRPSKTNSGGLDAHISPVVINEEGKVRNPPSWGSEPASEYDGLHVKAYCDAGEDKFWWGSDPITFKDVLVDLRKAESMVKVLRRINKRMAELSVTWGSPTDLAGFLGHLAQAIGCKDNYPFGYSTFRAGWSYDDNQYRWTDVDGLRHHLDLKIKDRDAS